MKTLANLTAANLAAIHNRYAGRPVTKFESKPVAISRTMAVLADRGISIDEALGTAPAPARIAAPAPVAPPAPSAETKPDALAAWDGLKGKPAPTPKARKAARADNAGKMPRAAEAAEPKTAKPARRPYGDKPAITDASILPTPPDFTANTHKPYRKKLDALTALVAARDIAGLEAFTINPTSTSPKALVKYRDRAIAALRFQNNEVV